MEGPIHEPNLDTSSGSSDANSGVLLDLFPIEVLTKIFHLVKGQYEHEFGGRKQSGWVVVSHVSQRWRDVAIGCGTLWRSIRSDNPDTAEWLERAGGTPLFVDLDIDTKANEAALVLVLKKLPQIQSFSIRIPASIKDNGYRRIWDHLRVISSNPAPLLESFEFVDNKREMRSSLRLFDNTFLPLHHYHSYGCSPCLPTIVFNNLTTLSIRNPFPSLTKSTLLAQLVTTPNLESLTLRNIIKPMDLATDLVPTNVPVVRLPNLKHLTFCGTFFNNDLDFLSHLSFTADTELRFVSSLRSPDLSALRRFVDVYNEIRNATAHIRALKIVWYERALHLTASNTFKKPVPGVPVGTPKPVILYLKLAGWNEDQFPESWTEDITNLPLTELQYLNVNCPIGNPSWDRLSAKCPKISHISVEGPDVVGEFMLHFSENYTTKIVKLLKDTGGLLPKGMSDEKWFAMLRMICRWKDPIFPSLRSIEIVGLHFDGGEILVELMRTALVGRVNFCLSCVRELSLRDCRNLEPEVLKEFRRAVTVYVDGVMHLGINDYGDEDWE